MTNEELRLENEALKKQLESANAHIDELHSEVTALSEDVAELQNLNITMQDVENTLGVLDEARSLASNMIGGVSLTPTMRQKLTGTSVGIRRAGFLDNIVGMIEPNMQFAPKNFNIIEFKRDVEMFQLIRTSTIYATQILRTLMDAQLELGSRIFRNGLNYYGGVILAVKAQLPGAAELRRRLGVFFSSHGRRHEEDPTEMEVLRDFKALEHGKKDGEIIIRNEGDKVIKGNKVVVDDTHKSSGGFKETQKGEIL